MSASIPPNRLEALKRAAKGRINETPIEGDKTIENVERYRIQWRDGPDQCWSDVEEVVHGQQKVLWVCNTVNDAIDVFRQAEQLKARITGLRTILYHSRFRYGGNPPGCTGRVELQKRVIEEFGYADDEKTQRRCPGPAIVVTTQVCEMSLNISADVLVTALCPLPSLVQRLGRLSRFARSHDPKPAYVYPFAGRPYDKEDFPEQLRAARDMIDELAGSALSQSTLAVYVQRMQSNEDWSRTVHSAWLDGGWESQPLPARDGDNSITVLREEDIAYLSADAKTRDVIPWTIPMLFKRGFNWDRHVRGYPVARRGSILYDEIAGASWDVP